jgi:SSS family solute:Na+ symporter
MAVFLSQILLFSFLLLFLVLGFLYKRTPKTIKEYALGNEKFTTPSLMATMVAAVIGGGSLIGKSSILYQNGLWLFFASLTLPIGYCFMALVIIPKLSKYYGCLSTAEIMGKMYGNYARKIVGVVAFLFCLGILSGQIRTFYWVMESMFADNALLSTIIGISAIILYLAMGGASLVTKTGIIQFFVFVVIFPLVASHIIQISGGIKQITATSARPFFYNGSVISFIYFVTFYLLPNLSPAYCHRLLIGMDCKKNQAVTYALAFVYLIITVFLGCISFIALSKFSDTTPHKIIFVVIENLIRYEWAIAFKIALVAIIISTADALINTGSTTLVHDVFPDKITEKQKINLLRGVTILSGIIAIAFACFYPSALDALLLVTKFYFAIVTIPFIAGLFIKETKPAPFWASAIMAFATFTILFVYKNFVREAFLISLAASLISYFAVFFALRKQAAPGFSFSIRKLCDGIVEKHAISLHYLGAMVLLFFMLSIFLKDEHSSKHASVTFSEFITGFLGFCLLFADKLSLKYKNGVILVVIWHCFTVAPIYAFLHQESANPFTLNFIVSLILLAGLFSWDIFLTSLLSGSVVAVLAFCCFGTAGKNITAPIMYLSLLLGCIAPIAYITLRKRESKTLALIENKVKASNAIEQASKESNIYNQIMHAAKISLDAQSKYREIILNENKTIMVSFNDLKEDILAYFQRISVEERVTLTIANTRHKVLNTGLPLGFFYRTIYSVIANVFHCNGGVGDISVRFCCDSSARIESIAISHGDHGQLRISDRARYFPGSYPDNILGWDILTRLFEQLEIKVTEGSKKLKIIFPSESDQINDNVLYLRELLQT